MKNYTVIKIYEGKNGVYCDLSPNPFSEKEEKISLLFRISDFYEAHIGKGDTVSEERFEELYEISSVAAAVIKAENMLSTGDYSRQRLISKLTHSNIDKSHAAAAADIMAEKGYINEEEQTKKAAAYYCTKKNWGKKRIAAELLSKGYCKQAVFDAVNSVSPEKYSQALENLVIKKFSEPCTDRKELDRRIASLSRMGFSYSEITAALKK